MTPKERAAMQQALEALESYSKSDYIKKQHPKRRANGEKAITALREALAEQAEQEPVGEVLEGGYEVRLFDRLPEETPLYAAPVRTKDLTDEEIVKVTGCEKDRPLWLTVSSIARAVIAADREKNK